jgi:aromatase
MAGHTRNDILIHAPIDDVWRITNDVAHWPDLFSEYAEANIVDQRDNTVRFELVMHPDENGVVWRWVSQRTMYEAERKVYAHRVETGPFEYMQIYWEYHDRGGDGTQLVWEQRFSMRPTAPLDDTQMTTRINTNSAVQLALIKAKIEEHHGIALLAEQAQARPASSAEEPR